MKQRSLAELFRDTFVLGRGFPLVQNTLLPTQKNDLILKRKQLKHIIFNTHLKRSTPYLLKRDGCCLVSSFIFGSSVANKWNKICEDNPVRCTESKTTNKIIQPQAVYIWMTDFKTFLSSNFSFFGRIYFINIFDDSICWIFSICLILILFLYVPFSKS